MKKKDKEIQWVKVPSVLPDGTKVKPLPLTKRMRVGWHKEFLIRLIEEYGGIDEVIKILKDRSLDKTQSKIDGLDLFWEAFKGDIRQSGGGGDGIIMNILISQPITKKLDPELINRQKQLIVNEEDNSDEGGEEI